MNFEQNSYFYVMMEDSEYKESQNAEILILIYEREQNREMQKSVIKIRTAPRQFKILNAVQFDTARLYYWNGEKGPVLLRPRYKVKDGIIRMDEQENLQYAREQSVLRACEEPENDWESVYQTINQWRNYRFDKKGYSVTEDCFSADWATAVCTVCYGKNAFCIGSREIVKFEVESHWYVEEAWEKLSHTRKGGKWSGQDLENWISLLDTYDTAVRIWYLEGTLIKNTRLIMRDHKRKQEFDVEWQE